MKYKNHIAILLAALILIKFAALDSHLLERVFNSNEITFVNTSCKHHNFQGSNKMDNFSESSFGLTISYHAFCNSFFNFGFPVWADQHEERIFQKYGAPTMVLATIYSYKISPPPKV